MKLPERTSRTHTLTFCAPLQAKEQARNALARKYKSGAISEEDILQCLYSIADNNTFLTFNRDPIDRVLSLLKVCGA